MISVNLSANRGATLCHMTCVEENPCSNISGGPLPPTRAKIRPELVLIHLESYPGNRSARSGMVHTRIVVIMRKIDGNQQRLRARRDGYPAFADDVCTAR